MPSDATATVRIELLDNSIHTYDVKVKSSGNVLLQAVMKDLNLLEEDYFGILHCNSSGVESFLDPRKSIKVQIPNVNNVVLKFAVKFFPSDPGQLHEEYTRYFFALQLKQDISRGLLYCNNNTLSVLASYIAQSEFGDWNSTECSDLTYLKDLKIVPQEAQKPDSNLDQELLQKISDRHKTIVGQTPADADLHLLDIARKLDSYGLRLHSARDQENTEIYLAVAHMGVVVFRGHSKINTFNWARIRKLSFKKKRFLVKLKTEANVNNHQMNVGDIIVFVMLSRDACKAFWKHCIEYHAFFRLEVHPEPLPQPRILKRGSTFRYSGKTQKELHDLVRGSKFQRTAFTRASSRKSTFRHPPAWSPDRVAQPMISTNDSVAGERVHLTNDAVIPRSEKTELEVNGHVINEVENSAVSQNQLVKDGFKDSLLAVQSWQIESENLHSNAVSNAQSQDIAEKTDVHLEEKSNDVDQDTSLQSSDNTSSPVNLHSGGTAGAVPAYDVGTVSTLSDNSSCLVTSVTALPSPTAIISPNDLRSTSSPDNLKQRSSAQDYFIAKEILTTERTYIKDLEVITTWFNAVVQYNDSSLIPENIANQLFGGTSSLLAIHKQFLFDLEERLSSWEGREGESSDHRVDDIMHKHLVALSKCLVSLNNGEHLISLLEELGASNPRFEGVYREFELQKVCYLPFNSFLLKPVQRIIHYKIVLENLMSQSSARNSRELEAALNEAAMLADATQESLKKAHNIQKLAQLRRDLIGVDFLLTPPRIFMREGSLYKLSRKGFQQRLFFLFSDCLLYTSKGVTMTNQFKVHAELPLKGMIIEINEGESTVPNCFSILSGDKTIIVAAASQEEMNKWLEDFSVAIAKSGRDPTEYQSPLSKGGRDSMNRLSTEQSSEDGDGSVRNSLERLKIPPQQRSNATMHVCWHRNTSVSSSDHLLSLQNQLSGYLLRKFKNSDGWQKLWVVFTNFCLFFYKSHQDESPLASLPLLGYTINSPTEMDSIRKEFVFKLQFKTHVYFFRAESHYTFNRWLQVISSATVTSQRTRLFSRMDSNNFSS